MATEEMILDVFTQVESKLPAGWKVVIAEGSHIRVLIKIANQTQVAYYRSVSSWSRLIYMESRSVPNIDTLVKMITDDVYDKYVNAATDYTLTRIPAGYIMSLANRQVLAIMSVEDTSVSLSIPKMKIRSLVETAFNVNIDPNDIEKMASEFVLTLATKAAQALSTLREYTDISRQLIYCSK